MASMERMVPLRGLLWPRKQYKATRLSKTSRRGHCSVSWGWYRVQGMCSSYWMSRYSLKSSKFSLTHANDMRSFSSFHHFIIAAEWEAWGRWSKCSMSCGLGSRVRGRSCSEQAVDGSKGCSGNSFESEDCQSAACPGWLKTFLFSLTTQKSINVLKIHMYHCSWMAIVGSMVWVHGLLWPRVKSKGTFL